MAQGACILLAAFFIWGGFVNVLLLITVSVMLAPLPLAFAEEADWSALIKQGYASLRSGKYQAALEAYRAAARIAEQPGHSLDRRAISFNAIGMVYEEMGRYADAEKVYRRSLAAMEQARGREDALYASMLANLGGSYSAQGRFREAEQLLREAIAIHQRAKPRNAVGLAMAQNRLAKALMNQRKFGEVDALLTDSMHTLETLPSMNLQLAMVVNNRGALMAYEGHYPESAEMFERCLSLMDHELGGDHPMMLQSLINLGTVYSLTGELETAGKRLERALSIAEHSLGTEHPVYGQALNIYADVLKKTGHKSEAKRASAHAREIQQSSSRTNGFGMAIDISALRAH